MLRSSLLIAIPAALMLCQGPARAGDFVFRFDGGALHSGAGVAPTYDALADRAARYCDVSGERGVWRRRAGERCFESLVSLAIAEIGSSDLAAHHASAGGAALSAR
jgi:UrcA family protein